jgi:hypothetical protein
MVFCVIKRRQLHNVVIFLLLYVIMLRNDTVEMSLKGRICDMFVRYCSMVARICQKCESHLKILDAGTVIH